MTPSFTSFQVNFWCGENGTSQIHVHIMVYINWYHLKNIHLYQNLTKLQHSKEKLSTFNFHNEIFFVVLCSLNLMVIIKHTGDYRYYSAWVCLLMDKERDGGFCKTEDTICPSLKCL